MSEKECHSLAEGTELRRAGPLQEGLNKQGRETLTGVSVT